MERKTPFFGTCVSRFLSKEAVGPFLNFEPLTTAGVDESFGFGECCESWSGGEVAACVDEEVGVAVDTETDVSVR